jgi:hypothetical protein
LVPNFSIDSYLPNSDSFIQAWESVAEVALEKGAIVGALSAASGYLSNLASSILSTPTSTFGEPFGIQVRGFSAHRQPDGQR